MELVYLIDNPTKTLQSTSVLLLDTWLSSCVMFCLKTKIRERILGGVVLEHDRRNMTVGDNDESRMAVAEFSS
jgi:hypothetical protein